MKQNIKHRFSKCKLRVTDSNNNVLANKKLSLKQVKHEFLFGCGAFDTLGMVMTKDEEQKKKLESMVNDWLKIYNYGTLPFYWGQFEPEEGKPNSENLMKAAKFLESHNVTMKGHPLCWHTVCADWLLKYDNETILKKQLERIEREVSYFKGTIDFWDVINEVVIMPIFDKYDNAITRICNDKGRVGLIKEVFKKAKEVNPNSTLLINDFNTSISYEILIDGCLEAGVPIDAIGIQSHQHQGYWGDEKVHEVLKRYEHFGLPIHFTENTLISGDIMPAHIVDLNDYVVDEWPTTPEGEERQMKEVESMYRILFEHPLVEAITGWDYADGAWLGAPSGVVRKDGSHKPVYDKLHQMIKEEWWTDCEVMTDENGFVEIEGIRGDYVISADGAKCDFTLSKTSTEANIVLK